MKFLGGIVGGIIVGGLGFVITTGFLGLPAYPFGLALLIAGATIGAVVGFVLVEKF